MFAGNVLFKKASFCVECLAEKQHQLSFPVRDSIAAKICELIYDFKRPSFWVAMKVSDCLP